MYEFTKVMFSIVDYCTVGMIPLNASNDWLCHITVTDLSLQRQRVELGRRSSRQFIDQSIDSSNTRFLCQYIFIYQAHPCGLCDALDVDFKHVTLYNGHVPVLIFCMTTSKGHDENFNSTFICVKDVFNVDFLNEWTVIQ